MRYRSSIHGGGPEQSRLELLSANAAIVGDIAATLGNFAGLLIVVTNPVGSEGVAEVLMPELSAGEHAGLQRSAEVLEQAHRSLRG